MEGNNEYWQLIPAESNFKIFSGIVAVLLIVFFVLQLFLHKERAMLILGWVAIHYLYFLFIYKFVASIPYVTTLKQYKYYLPFLIICSLAFFFVVVRAKIEHIAKFNLYITALFITMLMYEAVIAIKNISSKSKTTVQLLDAVKIKPIDYAASSDVFLIILDEYAGSNTLQSEYHYSNDGFITELENLGFFVAKAARSNYNGTMFSTLSMLSMSYLDSVSIGDLKSAKSFAKAAKTIEENRIFSFFESAGFKLVNNSFLRVKGTDNDPFLFLPVEDRLLMDKTFGSVAQNDLLLNVSSNKVQIAFKSFYARVDKYNQDRIENIKHSVSDTASKLFVYTHLMMPHSPYLRNEKGELRQMSVAHKELLQKRYNEPYLAYLKFSNKVVLDLIKQILAARKRPTVIVVSDHGNRFYNGKRNERDDFSNFISVYSPNRKYNGFTDSVSLVNVFRLLLNNQFNQNLEILENREVNVTKGVLHH
ncbi:hypothetical protein ESA94_05480 [Lacibacter luteus]|uniref:Sulfatase N-terminal domain-containing protein n=1 Tax=Lacibacter luteus TaxID=2508719 RepID=A0A4Q1CNP6_9BACT|nr:hypothetical protein [Lacibacter luteus]RXK62454.1 hypothetical protein ESA94_05480 [Lacibacter luteus]